MTLDEIKELIQVVLDSGVAELEVERGGSRVRIRRATENTHQEVVIGSQTGLASPAGGPPARGSAPTAVERAQPSASDLVLVRSPIVGTFYESSSPGSAPFVKEGDKFQPGQVLCIIESMKLMNEIEAEMAGEIVARLVENGRPVEYGEALFSVRPS